MIVKCIVQNSLILALGSKLWSCFPVGTAGIFFQGYFLPPRWKWWLNTTFFFYFFFLSWLSRYFISHKPNKTWQQVFWFAISIAINNAYILYKMSEAYHVTRYSRAQFSERLVKELLGLEDTSPSHWCNVLGGIGRGRKVSRRRYHTRNSKARNFWHHQCCPYPKMPSDATREVETLFLVAAGCKHVLQKVPQEKLTKNCISECPVGICTPETDLNSLSLNTICRTGSSCKVLLGLRACHKPR